MAKRKDTFNEKIETEELADGLGMTAEEEKSVEAEINAADTVSSEEPPPVEAAKKQLPEKKSVLQSPAKKYVYIGPSLPNGSLKSRTIFDGSHGDICNALQKEVSRYPEIKELLVPLEKVSEALNSFRLRRMKNELAGRLADSN